MTKVLHSAAKMTPSRGQLLQMTWEQRAATRLGLTWESRFFCPSGVDEDSPIVCHSDVVSAGDRRSTAKKIISWFKFRRSYYKWLRQMQNEYDVLLLRYNFHDPYQWLFVRSARCQIYFVHHTFEVAEMFSSRTMVGMLRGMADLLFGSLALRKATGIIGVTDEIAEYESRRAGKAALRMTVYPNGVEYTDSVIEDHRAGVPVFLFVAGIFAVWHGLDVLLKAISNSNQDLILHVVGEVSERERCLAIGDARVKLHGSMQRDAIRELAASCDVGLGSMAIERKNMKQTCALKVRDYLVMGLPVYEGCKDIFPESFPYHFCGPVEIESMINYAMSLRSVSRQDVARAARPFIDKDILLSNLMSFLNCPV